MPCFRATEISFGIWCFAPCAPKCKMMFNIVSARTILYDFYLIAEQLWSLESMIQEIPQPKCLLFDYHTFIFHMDVVFNRLQVDYNEEFYISVALMQALLDISQINENTVP